MSSYWRAYTCLYDCRIAILLSFWLNRFYGTIINARFVILSTKLMLSVLSQKVLAPPSSVIFNHGQNLLRSLKPDVVFFCSILLFGCYKHPGAAERRRSTVRLPIVWDIYCPLTVHSSIYDCRKAVEWWRPNMTVHSVNIDAISTP